MTLSEHQQEFALHIGYLLQHINAAGYACTFGDAYRSPLAFGGMGEKGPYGRNKSAHKQRLAVDLNLFKDGRYLDDTEDHRPIGNIGKPSTSLTGGVEIFPILTEIIIADGMRA